MNRVEKKSKEKKNQLILFTLLNLNKSYERFFGPVYTVRKIMNVWTQFLFV